MTPQVAMRAIGIAVEAEVDAYVDALLAVVEDAVPVTDGMSDAPQAEACPARGAETLGTPELVPPAQGTLARVAIREIAPPVLALPDTPDLPRAEVVPGQRWLRVAIGEDRYAVELLRVQEVVRVVPVIAVRGAAASLLGVMNLRGRIVPVHDLGKWLRAGQVTPDERARIVVLEHQDELVGLLVTAVTDVVTLESAQVEPPTPGTRDRTGLGIARTPGAPPTVLLDARVVFD